MARDLWCGGRKSVASPQCRQWRRWSTLRISLEQFIESNIIEITRTVYGQQTFMKTKGKIKKKGLISEWRMLEGVKWTHLACDRDQWWAVLDRVMIFRIPKNARNLSTIRESISFSKKTLLHEIFSLTTYVTSQRRKLIWYIQGRIPKEKRIQVFCRKPDCSRPLWGFKCGWNNSIKRDVTEIRC
jgi:hypothetical protein